MAFYILNEDGEPVQSRPEDILSWAVIFENESNRRVASTQRGDVTVSTVFLMMGSGPYLWETMIFGGDDLDGYQERSRTLDAAILQHRQAVRLAFPQDQPETVWGSLPGLNPDGTTGSRKVEEILGRSRWDRLLDDTDLV